jgi:hypothetical protein
MGDAGVGWIAAIIIGGIQKRAVADYLAGLEAEAQVQQDGDGRGSGSDGTPTAAPDRKPPKVISPSDPSSAWTVNCKPCLLDLVTSSA